MLPSDYTDNVVTFSVPRELLDRADAEHTAYTTALLHAANNPETGHGNRAVAHARRRLAATHQELQTHFTDSHLLFRALLHAEAQHTSSAHDDEQRAEQLDALYGDRTEAA